MGKVSKDLDRAAQLLAADGDEAVNEESSEEKKHSF